MAYIGNTVQNQGFAPAVDYFNGDGTTVTFTLSRPVASVAQLTAVIENVIQNPSTAFTVSGSSITFTSAPPSGTNNIWVEYTSLITTYAAISQDPTVIGDITATGGYSSTGDYGNSFVDGVIMDYVTGNARITTGASDGITLYNGGTSARSALMTISSAGNVGVGTSSPNSKLHVASTAAYTARFDSTSTASNNILLVGGSSYNYGVVGVATGNGTASGDVFTLGYTVASGTAATQVLNWTSSGNVGIGTSSPVMDGNGGLYVSAINSNGGTFNAGASQSGTANFVGSMQFVNTVLGTTDKRIASIAGITNGATNSGALTFNTWSSGSGAERMRIDSSGRVTTPYQPTFYVRMSASGQVSNGVYPFNTADLDIGSNYNTSTYRFTAPIAGTYYIQTGINYGSGGGNTFIRKNGTMISGSNMNHEVPSWIKVTTTAIVQLSAGDYVDVYHSGTGGSYDSTTYNYFGGYLLG